MVTDRGGRLALESVYCRKEISSLRTAESSFGSIALVGSYYQSTFSTFFNVLSHHLPKFCPGSTEITLNIFGSMQIARQENASIRVYSSQIARLQSIGFDPVRLKKRQNTGFASAGQANYQRHSALT